MAGFFVVGTEGTLELRKNLDIEGREGTDHMFVANRTATRYVDCSRLPVTYYRDFLARHRATAPKPPCRNGRCSPSAGWRCRRRHRRRATRRSARMIGIAVIGLGNALQPHATAWSTWRIARAWSGPRRSSETRLQDVAERYGFPTTTDIARAIADPAVDAVLVLTPANAHLPIARGGVRRRQARAVREAAGSVDRARRTADRGGPARRTASSASCCSIASVPAASG